LLPADCISYGAVLAALISGGRLDEAQKIADEIQAKKVNCLHLHYALYELAFLRGDTLKMNQLSELPAPKYGAGILSLQAHTAAYFGQLKRARELFRSAAYSARQSKRSELTGVMEVQAAEVEALLGNTSEARQQAAAALALSSGSDLQGIAALTLAITGDTTRAESLIDDLDERFPDNTLVQDNYLPTARAQLALDRDDPAKAIKALESAAPYELGDMDHSNAGYPIYLRGEAYLAAHQGAAAAAEFQKILAHPGVFLNDPIAALARLELARAYAAQGDTSKAKAAYADFLSLWKNADPDLPLYQQAKAEFAALH
jgi:ATP/maltotriose-dependent transcriptional regulator MalT